MIRLFREHKVRTVLSLNGCWTLKPLDESGRSFTAMVPGVWERIPALARYRGKAEYSRTVKLEKSANVLLQFGGASHTARVFWDDVQVASHYSAYTAFEALVENAVQGDHTLRVEVDNAYSEESTLHIPNDYQTYGGLNRPVEMQTVGDAFIRRMAFTCDETAEGSYDAHVRVYVKAIADVKNLTVSVQLAGACAESQVPALAAGEETCIALELNVQNAQKWELHQGNLYDLCAVLVKDGQLVDDLIDRVGFRTVKVDGEKILLNGRPVFLKGFCRHEDHGQFGSAISPDAMMDDLYLMLDMGVNSIRTTHYPNDPRFLDLCDELGLLVWEESHARAIPGEIMRKPLFAEQCRVSNEETVKQHINHPCIYVWGLLNECESETEFGRSVYETQIKQLRELDPSRPITFASCRHFSDVCLDLVDIVSFNIYPQWYLKESTDEWTAKEIAWMETAGAKNKPIIFSEFGAGGIAGFHDPFSRVKWSEERQADILEEQLTSLLNNPRVAGTYIWQFCDVRTSEETAWCMRRPKVENNKGVVDLYRKPKLSYNTVKAAYTAKNEF